MSPPTPTRCPEVLLGHECTEAIDVWSLGCVAVELLLGRALFDGPDEYSMVNMTRHQELHIINSKIDVTSTAVTDQHHTWKAASHPPRRRHIHFVLLPQESQEVEVEGNRLLFFRSILVHFEACR